jgi:hypothetical protein
MGTLPFQPNAGIEQIKQVWDTAGKKPGGLIIFDLF